MIIDDLRCTPLDEQCEISARVRRGDNEHLRLWWRFAERFTPAHRQARARPDPARPAALGPGYTRAPGLRPGPAPFRG